jgi:hypothetical protein
MLLKGIQHPDDVRKARDYGIDGIYCSNHGGRQANGGLPSLEALPAVVKAAEGMPVLFDSGVRSGSDVAKALALGATAVGLGRTYLYALAIGGVDGLVSQLRAVLNWTYSWPSTASPALPTSGQPAHNASDQLLLDAHILVAHRRHRDHRDGTGPIVAHSDTFPVRTDRHRLGIARHIDSRRDRVRDRVDDRERAIAEIGYVDALSVGTEPQTPR